MGLRNSEIRKRMEPILEFSGLERFKDAKLKNLSSGMQVRVGFSVAVETDPDIFLVDEALAVGDMEFQKKCIEKFKDFKSRKKVIVLVSHAMNLVKEFCERTIYLSQGQIVSLGNTEQVVNEYIKRSQQAPSATVS